ncbi:hypothetical protein [Pendulispora albinea]|uniref:Uncharacterized protein n=1 Tax=Pendulispora albinea TaxID=2741071 RepID=A0ABZ2LUJ9_9BACT
MALEAEDAEEDAVEAVVRATGAGGVTGAGSRGVTGAIGGAALADDGDWSGLGASGAAGDAIVALVIDSNVPPWRIALPRKIAATNTAAAAIPTGARAVRLSPSSTPYVRGAQPGRAGGIGFNVSLRRDRRGGFFLGIASADIESRISSTSRSTLGLAFRFLRDITHGSTDRAKSAKSTSFAMDAWELSWRARGSTGSMDAALGVVAVGTVST